MELKASSISRLGQWWWPVLDWLLGLPVSLWLGEALWDWSSTLRGGGVDVCRARCGSWRLGLGEKLLARSLRALSSSATESCDWLTRSGW